MQANKVKWHESTIALLIRGILLWAAEGLVGAGVFWLTRPYLAQVQTALIGGKGSSAAWSLEQLIVTLAAVLAATVYVGLVLATLVTLTGAVLRGCRSVTTAGRLAGPLWLQRAVLMACGLGLAAPVTTAAASVTDHAHATCFGRCHPVATGPALLVGLRLPDLPVTPSPPPSQHEPVVVVRPGDSLWLISRGLLPPAASNTEICREVHRLYVANRAAIGTDLDLIQPGTRLTTPGGIR